jgi:putative colanic acid biosynthesis acetyltransferase WcaF
VARADLRRQHIDSANRIGRALWSVVWLLLFRPSPRPLYGWRRWLLRCFGADIASTAIVHPSVRIWAPWNLVLDRAACLAPFVDCYSVDVVHLRENATVSQRAILCTASRSIDGAMSLLTAPIVIGTKSWVGMAAFIGPGVTIGDGAIVGATATVMRDVEQGHVVAGNPARVVRRLGEEQPSDMDSLSGGPV